MKREWPGQGVAQTINVAPATRATARAFSLIELLAVLAIVGLLVAMVLPSLSKSRETGRRIVCASHLREFGSAFRIYADENDDVMLPGRMFKHPGGKSNPRNWYHVGNGLKYRPRGLGLAAKADGGGSQVDEQTQ